MVICRDNFELKSLNKISINNMMSRKQLWQGRLSSFFVLLCLLATLGTLQAASYDPNAFVTKWKGNGKPIVVPFVSSSAQVRFYVEGAASGNFEPAKAYSNAVNGDKCLKFPTTNNIYILEIKGNIDQFSMSNAGGNSALGTTDALIGIEQWGTGKWKSMNGAFANCKNLEIKSNVQGAPDLSQCDDLTAMFKNCSNLTIVNPNIVWNLQNVKKTVDMFLNCSRFNDPKVANWNVQNVTDFGRMFQGAQSLTAKVDDWNVSKAVYLNGMFNGCLNFKGEGLEKWASKVNKVTNFYQMFYNCQSLNFDPTDWNIESATDIRQMFYDCRLLGSSSQLNFSNWAPKLKNVTSLLQVFYGCKYFNGKGVENWLLDKNNKITSLFGTFANCSEFNADLSNWHVDKVIDFANLFYGCEKYTGKGLENWKVGSVMNMTSMFRSCKSMNANLKDWDVSKVKNLSGMFAACPDPKTDFSNWNVGACLTFREMFSGCEHFNGNVQNWDVSRATDFYSMFSACYKFNADLSRWKMNSATNISSMFSNCKEFNADLSGWNVENVTETVKTFFACEKFNADISRWNFKNLQRMSGMFQGCKIFNADLRRWDVSHVREMDHLFHAATMFQGEHLGLWNVGEVTNFSFAFYDASAFIGDLSKWDMHSATDLTGMFQNSNCGNTDFSTWNIENVTSLASMFMNAKGNIYGVTEWNTTNVSNFANIFVGAKGMQHPIGHWDYSSLPEGGVIGLSDCGLSVDGYNRTLEGWKINPTINKPTIHAIRLYYSLKDLHDAQLKVSKGFVFIGDIYVDKNLSLTDNKIRLKVGEKKELRIKEQRGADDIAFTTEPTTTNHIAYDEATSMVEGKIPGRAVLRVTSNSMVNPPLHTFCDVEVYLPIMDLKWETTEFDVAIGDVINLRRKMKVVPYSASWPNRISFKVSDDDKEFLQVIDETSGDVKGLKEGRVTVTVETFDVENPAERITKTLTINIKNRDVEKIQITPNDIVLGVGTKVYVKVFFTPKNSTDKSVTFDVEGEDNTVISIDATSDPVITGNKIGACKLVARSANGKEAKVNVRVIDNYIPIEDVRYIAHSVPLILGSSRLLNVVVAPFNASNKKLHWESSDEKILTVDANGKIYALKEGKATVKVYSVENKKIYDVCDVDVYRNPVQGIEAVGVDEVVTIGVGEKYKLRYRLLPEGVSNREVVCISANPEIISVDSETAEVVGEKVGGPVEITIKALGADANAEVSLKIKVQCVSKVSTKTLIIEPTNLALFREDEKQLTLKILPEDATDRDVIWTSTSDDVVEVDENGYIKAKEVGSVTIKVALRSNPNIFATCDVSVQAHILPKSIELRPSTITIGEGDEYKLTVFVQPLNASKYTFVWTLEDPDNVFSLDEDGQIVKGVKVGTGKVIVTLMGNTDVRTECTINVVPKVATTSFAFEPNEFEIEFGTDLNLNEKLTFQPDNATDRYMEWSVDDPTVLQVREGYVRGLIASTEGVVVTAKLVSNPLKQAACRIKVKAPSSPLSLLMKTQFMRLKVGDERVIAVSYFPEDVTDRKLEWRSSNPDILSVNENGRVVAHSKGFVAVFATLKSNTKIVAACTIEVLEAATTELVTSISIEDVTLSVGKSKELNITYLPAEAKPQTLLFEGYDTSKIVITNGKVTALSPTDGTPIVVTAVLATDVGVRTTFKVTVNNAVLTKSFRLNQDKLTMFENSDAYLRVITEPEDLDKSGVVWSSNNEAVCTVRDGVVHAVAEGVATITAMLNGEVASCEVTVNKSMSSSVDDNDLFFISAQPNPFHNKLYVRCSGELSKVHYQLINAMGVTVRSGKVDELEFIIETTNLTSGFYLLRLTDDMGRTKSLKVLK